MSKENPRRISERFGIGKSYAEFDTLGFVSAHSKFLKVIKDVSPPLTIGLYGPWGSGKTCMIEALSLDLEKDGYLTLVFDAWKYRHERNLVLPLLCALERKYISKSSELKQSAKKIVTTVATVMLNQVMKKKVGVDIGEVKATLENEEGGYKHYKKYDDSISLIEKEYRDFISEILNKIGSQQLIIFIDNLDRCLPDIVVNLLEDISSFLSIGGVPCVYVLAMDRGNVIKAIQHRFPNFKGSDYLEKIVQISFNMPAPAQRDDHQTSHGLTGFMRFYEGAKSYTTKSKDGDSRDQIWKVLHPLDGVFRESFLAVPRRSHRFANKLVMLESMGVFDSEDSAEQVPVLLLIFLLKEFFPEIYDSLKDSSDVEGLRDAMQMSMTKENIPRKMRQEKEHIRPKNELIFERYCEGGEFYDLMKRFSSLAAGSDFPKVFSDLKTCAELIG